MLKYEYLTQELKNLIRENLKSSSFTFPTEVQLMNRYHVSRQTVRRCLAILEQEGLIRRRQGSGSVLTGLLPEGESNHIDLLMASPDDYIFPDVSSALRRNISSGGFTLTLEKTNADFDRERHILQVALSDQPRGMISECFSCAPSPNLDLYRALAGAGTKCVFLYGTYANDPDSACVKDDNEGGSRMLAEHLYRRGHRNIGGIFLCDTVQGRERCYGYQCALRDLRLSFSSDRVLQLSGSGLRRILAGHDSSVLPGFLETCLSQCSALVCYNDELSYHLLGTLTKMGIRVPEDISLVSFDDSYLRYSAPVPITSLAHEISPGYAASQCILAQLRGDIARSRTLPWKLREGASVRSL